jgi:protein-disulfide isomerase/uncharacterized membrane protein
VNVGKILTRVAIVCSLAATVISFKLLQKHLTGTTGSAWFDAGCDDSPGATANCAAVLASPYAYVPALGPNETPTRRHVPAAFLGLVYYTTLSLWFIGVGRPSRSRRWLLILPLALLGFGLSFSAYFTNVMFTRLNEWCPWCLATHVLNVVIAVSAVGMYPLRSRRGAGESPAPVVAPTPSWRVTGLTSAVIFFAVAGERELLFRAMLSRELATDRANFDQCMAVVNRLKGNSGLLDDLWAKARVCEIASSAEDVSRTVRPGAAAPFEAVVFSDFECRSCMRLAQFLEQEVAKLFDGRLKVTFKHYPLHSDCNPRTTSRMHPKACDAARLVEAARLLGGPEAFWRAHDVVFETQEIWKRSGLNVASVAAALGLDPTRLKDRMHSPEVDGRIREHADQAAACGLPGTPSVFVKGRLVDPVVRSELTFWDRLAEAYWKEIGEPRPESTRVAATPTTEGTPGRKAVP